MSGEPLNVDAKAPCRCHGGAVGTVDVPALNVRPDVDGKAPIHPVQRTLLDLGQGAGGDLLGRLEGQLHRAAQVAAHIVEDVRCRQQHGHVAVMSAGVHDAVDLAGKGQTGLLPHLQRVHIAPQQDGPAGLRAGDGGQNARIQPAGPPGDAQLIQLLPDGGAGIIFLSAQLRVSVEPAALFDQVSLILLCNGKNIHGVILMLQ